MATYQARYPGKLLLVGEYTILLGGPALARPIEQFSAEWAQQVGSVDPNLEAFATYLQDEPFTHTLDITALRSAVRSGWHLRSNIPTGYGLGSSGTVCAAVYDRFRTHDLAEMQLRPFLASLEGFFHGTSSGVDPLIIHLRQPLLLESSSAYVRVDLAPLGSVQLFLLDTGQARSTAPLVQQFRDQLATDAVFRTAVEQQWLPTSKQLIAAFLGQSDESLKTIFRRLSRWQGKHLKPFIPTGLQHRWQSEHYALKLCGAGGGGFMLGLSDALERSREELAPYELIPLET